jgi:hypothetical protein
MADLKTNYKDDVLDTSKNEKRKFRMIQNDDGTVSFDDATEYTQQGDAFGAADINATNAKINEQNQSLANKNKVIVICRPETFIYDNDSPDLYTEFTCEQNPNDFNLFTAVVSEAYIQTPVYIKEWYSDTEYGINISASRVVYADKHYFNDFFAIITWERNQTAPYKIKVRRARDFSITSTDGVSINEIGFPGRLFISVLQGIK